MRTIVRLHVDDAHVSSRLVASFAQLRLHCMFEEARLFLAKEPLGVPPVAKAVLFVEDNASVRSCADPNFVCAMKMGLFDIEVPFGYCIIYANHTQAALL